MNRLIIVFCATILYSCRPSYTHLEEYLQQNLQSESIQINTSKDTLIVKIQMNESISQLSAYLSSIASIQLYDTMVSDSSKYLAHLNSFRIDIKKNTTIESYHYPIKIIQEAKNGLNLSAIFIDNMLNGKGEQNARYVDLEKVSLEELVQLNTINEQIQSSFEVMGTTFDGFKFYSEDPNMIEYRGNIVSNQEVIPVVFQYDRAKKKLFYFGINE